MEYAALDAAVTPIIMENMPRDLKVKLFPGAKLGRSPYDSSFKHSIISWRLVFVDTTDPNAQRKLKAKPVVPNELVVSQSWNTGYQIPPKLPLLPRNGSDGPYVDTSGLLQIPSPTGSIGSDMYTAFLNRFFVGTILGKSKEKCVGTFLQGSAALLPADTRLHYPQRSKYVEFQDGVVLFVNMPVRARGESRSYPNESVDDGRALTWFLTARDWQQGQSDLAHKLTCTTSVIALFVRLGSSGSFRCCGRCRLQADDSFYGINDEPVADLVDWLACWIGLETAGIVSRLPNRVIK